MRESIGPYFDAYSGSPYGGEPVSGLVQGSDGYFYGTTYRGGTNNLGTIFKISTNGVLTYFHIFDGYDGAYPWAGLVQGRDGYFYGTTRGGNGNFFRISADGACTSLYSFYNTSLDYGADPLAGLVQGSDGSFYGTTSKGGTNNLGTVFRLTIVPPQLTITPSGGNVILSWPTNYIGFATNFTLKFATNLVSPTVWNTNSTAPVVIGDQNVVTNPISGTQMFYRLSQ